MQEFPLYSVPSSLSIISGRSHSTLPGPATACIPEKAKMMPVRMDVNVHLEQGQGVAPCQIAAALAESARQLAQSAANFEQEEGDVESMWSHSNISSQRPSHSVIFSHSSRQAGSRRQLFPNYFSAKLRDSAASSLSLDKPVNPDSLDRPVHPVVHLDRPVHPDSLDRPVHPVVHLDRPVHPDNLDRPGHSGKGQPVRLDRQRLPVMAKPGYLVNLNKQGYLDRQPISLDRAEYLDRPGHPITLDSPSYPVSLNREGYQMCLDRHGLPISMDRAGCLDGTEHFNTLGRMFRPGHLDRPGHAGGLDRAGQEVTLDGPGHPAMLDKQHERHGHVVSLDNPGLFQKSSDPLSLVHSSGPQDVMLDYKILLSNSSGQQKCNSEDGLIVLPQHRHLSNHSLQNSLTPSQQQRRKYHVQTEHEGLSNISLDLPPAQQLDIRHLQQSRLALTLEGGKRRPEAPSIENETELGTGTDSEVSILKTPTHFEAVHNLSRYLDGEHPQQVSVNSLPHGNNSMHVHEDSSSSQMQGSSLMSPPDSQFSSSLLPRSGSGLSLDPTLGSTVSGYAATGSSSSTETISKSMPSSELTAETPRQGLGGLTQSLDSGYMQGPWMKDRIDTSGHMRDYRIHHADIASHVMCAKDRSAINLLKSSVASKPYADLYPEEHRALQEDEGLMVGSPASWWHHHHPSHNRWSDMRHDLGAVAMPTWVMQSSKLDYAVHGPGESMNQHTTIPHVSSKTIAIDI